MKACESLTTLFDKPIKSCISDKSVDVVAGSDGQQIWVSADEAVDWIDKDSQEIVLGIKDLIPYIFQTIKGRVSERKPNHVVCAGVQIHEQPEQAGAEIQIDWWRY